DLAPGKVLDNPYSGNVVDICPVGALTDRDFRFRARVWYLERTPSVCGACANGCNIEIYHREGRIFRFQPRKNSDVNQYWMCDAGRMSYRDLQGEGRLLNPFVRRGSEFVRATWESALGQVAGRLGDLARTHGPGAVGIIVSAEAANEEVFLLRRFATRLEARLAGIAWSPPDADHDDFLIKADKNPNTRGLALQGLTSDPGEILTAAARGDLRALVLHRVDVTRWCARVPRSGASATRLSARRAPRPPSCPERGADERSVPALTCRFHAAHNLCFNSTAIMRPTDQQHRAALAGHAGRTERFLQGKLTPDEWRPIRLSYGLYYQLDHTSHMQRIKIPGGILSAGQLEGMADIADRYGRGIAHVTTRQDIQLHWIPVDGIIDMYDRLLEVGITTRGACADSV